ncbi:hypothetical protein H4S03_009431, partial [Coemansia sp. S3946]
MCRSFLSTARNRTWSFLPVATGIEWNLGQSAMVSRLFTTKETNQRRSTGYGASVPPDNAAFEVLWPHKQC